MGGGIKEWDLFIIESVCEDEPGPLLQKKAMGPSRETGIDTTNNYSMYPLFWKKAEEKNANLSIFSL